MSSLITDFFLNVKRNMVAHGMSWALTKFNVGFFHDKEIQNLGFYLTLKQYKKILNSSKRTI